MAYENSDIMQVEFHCNSFTTVANHCLEDTSLPLDARGLLITMISLRNDWHYSVEGLEALVPDGNTRIRRILNDLEDHGYLYREKYRNERGHFKYRYHIYDESQKYHDAYSGKNPNNRPRFTPSGNAERNVLGSNNATLKDQSGFTTVENPHVDEPAVEVPSVENEVQYNTNKSNTNIKILKSINRAAEKATTALPSQDADDEIDMIDKKMLIRSEYEDKLGYEMLLNNHPDQRKLVELIFDVISETIAHDEIPYKKLSGSNYSYKELKAALEDLAYENIEYVINCIAQTGPCIKSPANYVLQCLIKAKTMDVYNSYRTKKPSGYTNNFNNFPQNEYNFTELEQVLLDN